MPPVVALAVGPVGELVTTFKQLSETLASARSDVAIEDEPVPAQDAPGVILGTDVVTRTDAARRRPRDGAGPHAVLVALDGFYSHPVAAQDAVHGEIVRRPDLTIM